MYELWVRFDDATLLWVLFGRPVGADSGGFVIATLYPSGIVSTETVDIDARKAWKIMGEFELREGVTNG